MVPAASAAALTTLAAASLTPPEAFSVAFSAASLTVELASLAVLLADLYLIDSGLGTPLMPRSSVSKTGVTAVSLRGFRCRDPSTYSESNQRGWGQCCVGRNPSQGGWSEYCMHVRSCSMVIPWRINRLAASRQCTEDPELVAIPGTVELIQNLPYQQDLRPNQRSLGRYPG